MSSKNLWQTRLLPGLHHKALFTYEWTRPLPPSAVAGQVAARGLQGGLRGPGRLSPETDGGMLDEAVWLARSIGLRHGIPDSRDFSWVVARQHWLRRCASPHRLRANLVQDALAAMRPDASTERLTSTNAQV